MKIKSTSVFLFLILTVLSYGQRDSLNQLNKTNKKEGRWVEYLNASWQTVNDSSNAAYYRYTHYDNGINIYRIGVIKGKLKIMDGSGYQDKGKKLLDGEYAWLDNKGRTISIYNFKKGELAWCKYFYPSGNLEEYHDYEKKFKEEPLSYFIEIHDKKGNISNYYYRKIDKMGWTAYQTTN